MRGKQETLRQETAEPQQTDLPAPLSGETLAGVAYQVIAFAQRAAVAAGA